MKLASVEAIVRAGTSMRVLRLDALLEMKRKAGRAKDLADVEELLLIKKGIADE
jgi:hypothetical protein